MDKNVEFIELAKEVCSCHLCSHMLTKPHCKNNEYLENDGHGFAEDKPYVNLWNLWHGNLNAEIMVIGQDFGQKEDALVFLKTQKSKEYTNPTDVAIRELFRLSFDIDVDDDKVPLFFTNMANCYRKHKTTGGMHPGWLPICANKYMARLIRIIEPKIIIVLGRTAFESMFCMDGLTVECVEPVEKAKDTFKEIIQREYILTGDDFSARIFPVYHPGANIKRNQNEKDQLEVWRKIAYYYKKGKTK